MQVLEHDSGSFRFIEGIVPYSGGVAATSGHEVVWATFRHPRPLRQGIARAAEVADTEGLGPSSVCAFALRSPGQMDLDAFAELNATYRQLLAEFDVLHDDPNPIARTNVIPYPAPPSEPLVHGFAYVRSAPAADRTTFVIAGAAEIRTKPLDLDAVVRPGDTSPEALVEKADQVLETMGRRLQALGLGWDRVTTVDLYVRHDVAVDLAARLAAPLGEGALHGVRWFPSGPPIAGLDFEMDVRGVAVERFID